MRGTVFQCLLNYLFSEVNIKLQIQIIIWKKKLNQLKELPV